MLLKLAAVIGTIALGNGLLSAQTFTAAMTGTVRDTSGGAIPAAAITVTNLETGLTRATAADGNGFFTIPSLPVGRYEVAAEKNGFQRGLRRGIDLAVGQEALVDLTLQLGNVDQQVTVTDAPPLVNSTLASTSGLIGEREVKDLPLNGRSFDQLITLNAGTSNYTSNTTNSSWNAFSVAGKRPETNRFTLNGVDWVGANGTGLFITPYGAGGQLLGVEAVREFNVLADTYGAGYGKRAGGQINIVTSSGTNQLHGDIYEYLRNSDFDARNFFDQTIGTPGFKRHQFGGTLGGPLQKDKMFLFGNYEAFRQRLAVSSAAVVPGAFARKGLLPDGSAVPALKPAMLDYANAFWPVPNSLDRPDGTAIAYANPRQSVREDFGLIRFDSSISHTDLFSAHYTVDNGIRTVPAADANFANTSELHSQTAGVQETHVFSAALVNLATIGYARAWATQVSNPTVSIPSNLVFLPGGNPGSIIIGGGIVTTQPSAVVPAPGNNPQMAVRNYFTAADDLHFNKGRHALSAGGWIQRVQQGLAGAVQGSAASVAYPTVMAFLQDRPSQAVVVRNPAPVGYRSLEAAWYLEDEIKLRRNLTMRVGLRDEMTNGWNEVAGRCANYFYDANFVVQTNPHIGGSCLARNNARALWQPRAGLAWDPAGRGLWAVRASAGIHNDLMDNLGFRTYNNPPYNARETLQIPVSGFLSLVPLDKNAPLPRTCGPGIASPCSIYQPSGIDPNMFTPTIQVWTFAVERQIATDMMLEVGYVGSQSYHTNLPMDTNTAPPELCREPQGCRSGGVLAANQAAIVPQGTTYMPSRPPVVVNGITLTQRPNPYVSNNTVWFDVGTSSYHALNVSLRKRPSYGLALKANYSFGKVMDLNSAIATTAGTNEPADVFSPYNLFLNRGPASFSLHHQFNASFSYQLPFGSGRRLGSGARGSLNRFIGGWQWNGIFTAQGGFPITPLVGFNNSGTGDTNVSDVPNWNPDFHGPVISGSVAHWFDRKAFTLPIPGTFGNVSRGSLRGPGLVDFDTSVFKTFRVRERWNLQFRAEAFNVFNHANFFNPNAVVFSGNSSNYAYNDSAGQITAAAAPRQIQLALKLSF